MANIIQFTEQFDDAYWANTATVTADTDAAPASYGPSATPADQIADISNLVQENIVSTYETIPDDSSDWTASLFVKKEAVVARYCQLLMQMAGGATVLAGISIDHQNGTIADADGGSNPPDAKGIIDFDSRYWRVWWRKANNGSGNTIARIFIFPTVSENLGDVNQSIYTGSFIVWGANLTNTSTVQSYEWNPGRKFLLTRP